ncbi:MAG: patatin family protein [Prevotella sp.]|nr:patatin family protein [Prevotella sp.]
MKTGLVLEGGALRGLFSAGVMDVMMENGISFDGIVGVSAGAAFGCNYKSRQAGRAIRYNKRFARDWRYCSLRSLLLTGDLFGADYAYHYVPDNEDIFDKETFAENPMEFHVVCTDVDTGAPVYKRLDSVDYDCYEWIRASASMPLASRVVSLEGRNLLDGGVSDSIPLQYFQSLGYDRNVVILTQPLGYVKRQNRLLPLMRLVLRRYPNFLKAMKRRPEMYNGQTRYVEQAENEGSTLVIRPSEPIPIGYTSHNPDEMQRAYDMGRAEGLRSIDRIKAFVNAAHA